MTYYFNNRTESLRVDDFLIPKIVQIWKRPRQQRDLAIHQHHCIDKSWTRRVDGAVLPCRDQQRSTVRNGWVPSKAGNIVSGAALRWERKVGPQKQFPQGRPTPCEGWMGELRDAFLKPRFRNKGITKPHLTGWSPWRASTSVMRLRSAPRFLAPKSMTGHPTQKEEAILHRRNRIKLFVQMLSDRGTKS